MNIYEKVLKTKKNKYNQEFIIADKPVGKYTNEVLTGLKNGDYFCYHYVYDDEIEKYMTEYEYFKGIPDRKKIMKLYNKLSENGDYNMDGYWDTYKIYKVDTKEKKGYRYILLHREYMEQLPFQY